MNKRKVMLILALMAILAMLFALNALAADNTPVKVKVQTSIGVRDVTTTVGKIFVSTPSGSGYTITGVKNFDNYSASSIRELHIPYDATEVNFTTSNAYIKTIIFDDYSKAKVTSLSGLSGLKSVIVKNNVTISFGASCLSNSVEELLFEGTGGNIIFSASAFKDKTTLKRVSFKENCKYSLGANCFQNTGLTELSLVDGSTFAFSGAGAFYGCKSLKSVYIGNEVKTLSNTPFENCGSLDVVQVAALTNIADQTFRVANSGDGAEKCQLKLYIHSPSSVTIGANSFTNRNTYGVVVCALSPSVTSLNSCKYEIHAGIPHAYTEDNKSTCYNTYKTDCPCGEVRNAYYKLYVKGQGEKVVELISGPNPSVPHVFSSAVTIDYPNGIDKSGLVEAKCSVCGTLEGCVRNAPAIVEFPGYSVSTVGTKGMVVGIKFNSVSIKQYEEVYGVSIEFGLIAASSTRLGSASPLKADGSAYSNAVLKHDMSALNMYDSTLKLSNLSSALQKQEFILAGYIKIGNDISYIQQNGVSKSYESVTFNQLSNQK
ncbi:MAG: leucine-rich repeat protein [Clostridia bacterium]|nr:leucine-rich repeat protein [Clostridia bacterium]